MGVKGLWRLLLPIGRRISIETLEGKVLAIDASIWLTQFLKAMRDPDTGSVRAAAHLIGFFRRLCKLRFHGVRPVLVFDGATPEIKKREILQRRQRREKLTLGDDSNSTEAVQRLAKRILVAELKKRKLKASSSPAKGAGAYAPGFNPDDEEESVPKKSTEEAKKDESKETAESTTEMKKKSQAANMKDSLKITGAPEKKTIGADSLHPVELELDESEWKEGPTVETVNDFEAAVIEVPSSDDDEKTNPFRFKSIGGGGGGGADNDIFFDINRVSKMCSHDRKEIVEDAKRKQRMQSRREFMPVAANPEAYSQSQLRNFLRSTKLNKHVVKMAIAVTGKDEGMGERMASDATRRIIFTKDTDSMKTPDKAQATLSRKQIVDDGDDEYEWEDGNDLANKTDPVESSTKTVNSISANTRSGKIRTVETIIDIAEDEPGDETDGGFLPSSFESKGGESEDGGGGFLQEASEEAHIQTHSSAKSGGGSGFPQDTGMQQNQYDSYEEGGGSCLPDYAAKNEGSGFLPTTEMMHAKDDSSEEGGAGFLPAAASENGGVKSDVDKSKHKGDDGDGGGFVPALDIIHLDNDSSEGGEEESGGGFLPEIASDACRAQELEDKILARNLQNAELEEVNSAEKKGDNDRDAALATQLQIEEVREFPATLQNVDGGTTAFGDSGESDGSEDDVDWEDGDDGDGDNENPSTEKTRQPNMANDAAIAAELQAQETGSPVNEVEELGISIGNDPNVEAFGSNMKSDRNCDESVDDADSKDGALLSVSMPTKGSLLSVSKDFSGRQAPDANTAALEHAQSTAANLTDWAGRAFRRAIAKHVEETGGRVPHVESPGKEDDKKAEQDNGNCDHDGIVLINGDSIKGNSVTENGSNADAAKTITNQSLDSSNAVDYGNGVGEQTNRAFRRAPPMDLLQRPTLESLQEQADLYEEERRRQERDMDTMTDEMKEEVIQLIRLFGIPYVEAPAEAEAQCAALEELGLVDGIVTEDSDVFVFGGKTIYRHIFQDQKYVEAYLTKDAERDLALGRNEFVALSMLLGGDYTEGVKGVGIVNGMEILQAFDVSSDVKSGLEKFRQWLDGFDPADVLGNSSKKDSTLAERTFQVRHRMARTRWTAPQHFPADNVLNAYLNPVVDKSNDEFSWGTPDLENLLLFCQRNMGWDSKETERMLIPVIEKVTSGSHQTRIESFFMAYEDNIKFAKVKSKRLREVFQTIQDGDQNAKSNSEIDRDDENVANEEQSGNDVAIEETETRKLKRPKSQMIRKIV